MRQHTVQDAASAEYAGALESIWNEWDPWLRRAERLLHAGPELISDQLDACDVLRRVQYRAHTASEFAAGLNAPIAATDSHEFLVAALGACRDTMGALAAQAEYDELDVHSTEIGLHAIAGTRDAFHSARCSTMAAFAFTESLDPVSITMQERASHAGTLIWALVAMGAALTLVLSYVLVLLTAGA